MGAGRWLLALLIFIAPALLIALAPQMADEMGEGMAVEHEEALMGRKLPTYMDTP